MRLLPAVSAAVLLCPAMAQAADISLHVVQQGSGTPLASAAIVIEDLQAADPVAVGSTDADGRTVLKDVPAGTFRLSISAAGHDTIEREVRVGDASTALDFGRFELVQSAGDAIVVSGSRQRPVSIAPGVNSFDIAGSALASSGTLTSALRGLPGVTVQSEGTVELRGNDRVTILINGKPSALTGIGNQASLDAIPASNIARIEVINNPSAAQGAQGSAGIINIIMREESQQGWSGHIGFKGGFGAMGRRRADLPTDLGSYDWTPKASPYFSLRHGGDRLDFNLQGEVLVQRRLPNNEFTTRFYDDGRQIVSQVPENRRQTQYVLRGGADWRLSDADTLSFIGAFDLEDHIDVAQVPYIDMISGNRSRFWSWRENEQTGHASAALAWRHEFPEAGHSLSLRAEYIRGWEDETYRLNEVSSVRTGTDQTRLIANENTVPITLDYVRPFGSGQIELGAKAQFRWLPVRYEIVPGEQSIIYPGLGDRSDWQEQIYAGYINLLYEMNWLTVEGGVRAEQTSVSYTLDPANIYYPDDDAYSYFRIFPNVRLTAAIGSETDLSLFYNHRVDRPGEPELRVFPKYDDPELLKVGNPYFGRNSRRAMKCRWRTNGAASMVPFRCSIAGSKMPSNGSMPSTAAPASMTSSTRSIRTPARPGTPASKCWAIFGQAAPCA